MDDLISRQDAIDTVGRIERKGDWRSEAIIGLKLLPSADRPKGEWEHEDGVYGLAFCSNCEFELRMNDTNFCPNCGADMRGADNEATSSL